MISYIKFKSHPILGNAEFDFRKKDGSIYKNVLIIGENGSGKTTLLKSLNLAINGQNLSSVEAVTFEYEGKTITIKKDSIKNQFFEYEGPIESCINPHVFRQNDSLFQKQGCVYSSTRTNFQLESRNYQHEDDIDSNPHFSDEQMDYSSILNLFFNLENLDLKDYAKENKSELKTTFDDYSRADSRTSRFKTAFNNFFDGLKFTEIDTANLQNIQVFFEKYGNQIEISNLSSGEKQIVFRGTNVLKNKSIMDDGIILIDEPELSLHPKWQSKILKFYKDAFTKNGKQIAQIITSSHSENIVIEAMKSRTDTLIIKMSSPYSGIEIKRIEEESLLPSLTYAEASYLTFGVLGIEYHAQLFGYMENYLNTTVLGTDSYIVTSHHYNPRIHEKINTYRSNTYHSISSYIRNAFDHPYQNLWAYNESDIDQSIKLLRLIISDLPS